MDEDREKIWNARLKEADDRARRILDGNQAELELHRSRVAELEEERDRLKSAFDDRVRVIELQLEDKKSLRARVDEYEKEAEETLKFWAARGDRTIERDGNPIQRLSGSAEIIITMLKTRLAEKVNIQSDNPEKE